MYTYLTNNTKLICSSKLLSIIAKSNARTKCKDVRKASSLSLDTGHEDKLIYISTSEEKTADLAIEFSKVLKSGLCLCLYGQIGTGKSVFSRAYIRKVNDDWTMPVPSPTYLLQNIYDEHESDIPVYHYDLYRLNETDNFERLEFEKAFLNGISLIEWANKLGNLKPKERIDIYFKNIGLKELSSNKNINFIHDVNVHYDEENLRLIEMYFYGIIHNQLLYNHILKFINQ